MATIILLLLPILHPLLRGWKWRILAVAAMVGLSLALFYTPLFQERFFYDGSGTLTELFQGQIRGSGRVEAWPLIWQEAWNRPFLGHGVGTTYAFVPTVWDGMNHVQNDFLRIGYELGLVGLASFLAVMIWQIRSLWKRMNQSEGTVRIAAAAALLGIFAFLVGSWTGNTLVYNLWYMSPLFAVMGAVYGVSSQTIDH